MIEEEKKQVPEADSLEDIIGETVLELEEEDEEDDDDMYEDDIDSY